MLVYGECECFVMQMLYVCVLCASCCSSQCCVLHDLQFLNTGRGCNRRPYGRSLISDITFTRTDIPYTINSVFISFIFFNKKNYFINFNNCLIVLQTCKMEI